MGVTAEAFGKTEGTGRLPAPTLRRPQNFSLRIGVWEFSEISQESVNLGRDYEALAGLVLGSPPLLRRSQSFQLMAGVLVTSFVMAPLQRLIVRLGHLYGGCGM